MEYAYAEVLIFLMDAIHSRGHTQKLIGHRV
jgi:hypothetical protein